MDARLVDFNERNAQMGSVKIIVGHNWTEDVRYLHNLRDVRPSGTSLDLVEIRDIIDIVVDGRNITSAAAEESIFGVIGDLIDSLVDLLEGRSRKALVEFHCEPWELVVDPNDGQFEISLYSIGHQRQVIAHRIPIERSTFLEAVTTAARSMLDELYGISETFNTDAFVQEFDDKLRRLERADAAAFDSTLEEDHARVRTRRASTSTATGLTLRYALDGDFEPLRDYSGEYAFDMHALLFPGCIEAEYGGRNVELSNEYPFLCVLALVDRARELLGALETSDGPRFSIHGSLRHATFGVDAEGRDWSVSFGSPAGDEGSLILDLPASDCLDAVLTLGELLIEDLRDINYRLDLNHRLEQLEREVHELRNWYEELSGTNVYFDDPEEYLDQKAHVGPTSPSAPAAPTFPWSLKNAVKLFPQRQWEYRAERIYLSGIETTSHGLFVPSSEALTLLDWETGEAHWRLADDQTTDAPTSFALTEHYAVISERDGLLAGLDVASGERRFETDIDGERDRLLLGAAEFHDSGVVVLAERRGRAFGISPGDGSPVWRFEPGHGRLAGCVFEGPLVGLLTREGFFHGLDPTDGTVLWKVRLGGLAQLEPIAHQGRLYAFIHDSNNRYVTARSLYPYTGRTDWQARLEGSLIGRPSFADQWLFLPIERRGRQILAAIDVESSEPDVAWELDLEGGRHAPSDVVDVIIDDQVHGLIQTDRYETTCFEVETGEVRWRKSAGDGMWRNGGRARIVPLGDCLLTVREAFEIRDLATGRLLHKIPQPFHAPEFLTASGALSLVVGEANTPSDIDDRLVGVDLNHFLVEVDEDDG